MFCFFFFQAEDGIRDLVRSRGLGDVYKRQALADVPRALPAARLLVQDLCDRLRNDQRTQAHYIERAEAIEKLSLIHI